MAVKTKIEWTDATWNPVTGCTPVSEGCRNCWARQMAKRLAGRFGYPAKNPFQITVHEDRFDAPLRWRKPRIVGVCLMGDLFHEDVAYEFIDKVFAIMALCPQHTFLVLTKRPEQMAAYLNLHGVGFRISQSIKRLHLPTCYAALARDSSGGPRGVAGVKGWPLPNVGLGISAENQARFNTRRAELVKSPAAFRFVSLEPLLEPIETSVQYCTDREVAKEAAAVFRENLSPDAEDAALPEWKSDIDWIIVGGESGPGARPMDLDWVRSIRDQCVEACVPFFFKQHMEGRRKISLPELDGHVWDQMPAALTRKITT